MTNKEQGTTNDDHAYFKALRRNPSDNIRRSLFDILPSAFLVLCSADSIISPLQFQEMAIRIFITGGTFDKEYNELNGQLYFKDTHLQELLAMGTHDNEIRLDIRSRSEDSIEGIACHDQRAGLNAQKLRR